MIQGADDSTNAYKALEANVALSASGYKGRKRDRGEKYTRFLFYKQHFNKQR